MTGERDRTDPPPVERPVGASAVSAVLAVVGGLAWGLCFGPEPTSWLSWVALVPLVLLLGRPRPLLWGWLHGIVFWGVSMPWLIDTLRTYGGLPIVFSWIAFALLIVFLGSGHALFAWLGARLKHRGGWALYGAVPALWVVLELVRGLPIDRFPWNLAAYAWVDVPGVLPLASWIGAFGVSGLVVLVAVCLAEGLLRRRPDKAAWGVLAVVSLLVLAGRFAFAEPVGERRTVLVVQPNTPIITPDEGWLHYQRLVDMSTKACEGAGPGLLIWPESAVWPFNYVRSPQVRADVAELVAAGCPVILGAAFFEGQDVYNAALLVGPGGEMGRYAKRRLVPYGEYVPLSKMLPFIGTLARAVGNFTPGHEVGLLPWEDERLAMAICYEVVFPAAVAEQVQAGATALVTITNDAWYGDTAAPHQHFRAVRFRAAENRRPMMRAALTGISALVDARGAVRSELGVGEEDVIVGRLAGIRTLSPYTRAPWLVPSLALLLLIAGLLPWPRGRR